MSADMSHRGRDCIDASHATVAGWQQDGLHSTGGRPAINYSSKLERFSTAHWNSRKHREQRETDVEAAADEPLLGQNDDRGGPHRSIFGTPMLQPSSTIVEVMGSLTTLVDMTYTAFLVPISIAFDQHMQWNWLAVCDLSAGAVFTAMIFMQLTTGQEVRYNLQRRVVMDGWVVARMSVRHGYLIIDFLSALPSWIEALYFLGVSSVPTGNTLRALLCLRWLRMLRLVMFVQAQFVVNVLRNLGRRFLSWQLPLQFLYLGDIMYCALVLTNVLGMIWLWTAVLEGPENSWLAHVGDNNMAKTGSKVDQYFASVFFAMTTMSTNGYGDIAPRTTIERAVAIAIMMAGVLFFGYVISALSVMLQMFSPEARRAILFRDKVNKVDSWMSYRHLPNSLRSDITGYYANSWVPQSEIQEAELFEELPAFLRGAVAGFLVGPILKDLSLWQVIPESERWRLAALLHPQQLLPGHDLCQEGETASAIWLLQEGELLAIKNAVQWTRLAAPALVGEEAIQKGSRIRSCTFRAVGGCTLWGLDVKELGPLLKAFPDIAASLSSGSNGSGGQGGSGVFRSLDLAGIRQDGDQRDSLGNLKCGPIARRGKGKEHPGGDEPQSEQDNLKGS